MKFGVRPVSVFALLQYVNIEEFYYAWVQTQLMQTLIYKIIKHIPNETNVNLTYTYHFVSWVCMQSDVTWNCQYKLASSATSVTSL